MPGRDIRERAFLRQGGGRRRESDSSLAELVRKLRFRFLSGNAGLERVEIKHTAGDAAARAAKDILYDIDVHVALARTVVAAGAVEIIGTASGRSRRKTE